MKRATLSLFAVAPLLATFGCAHQAATPEVAARSPAPVIAPSEVSVAVNNLPQPDRSFVRQAAGAHRAAIRAGQLAIERGSTAEIRDLGREMIDTHTRFGEELREAAREDGVILPVVRMTKHQQRLIEDLSATSGPDFDRAFVDAVTQIQRETIESFQREALRGVHPQLREFANESLPRLNDRVRYVQQQIKRM